ncbi:MAG TPA: sigma-54 dependent transcriptional regulator [Candidatus Sumerlaeota bacterium]|nr:sigma-54 dependent transcriptional regulator [Candidatus Sumerlaeota bacterium]
MRALVVEDDASCQTALAELVQMKGFEVVTAGSIKEARSQLRKKAPDLALVDLNLPDGSGMGLINEIDEKYPSEVVVITGNTNLETAVEAMQQGALDYLTKPIDVTKLKKILDDLAQDTARRTDNSLQAKSSAILRASQMVFESPAMHEIVTLVTRVAATEASVMIIGESGTGKELVAQMIHDKSPRADGPFLPINCGAIAPNLIESELFGHERGSFTGAATRHLGYFEQASGGTLFLDEVTEMPLELQVKLLRALETSQIMRVGSGNPVNVDVRVIAATNRQPEGAIEDGKLRRDLYYRLNVFPIEMPPLRARPEDIVCLGRHFLAQFNAAYETKKVLTDEGMEKLCSHSWPGNVRELRNLIYRAFILADDEIGPDVINFEKAANGHPGASVDLNMKVGTSIADAERRLILATLDAYQGNKKKTARVLGVSLKTLYNRLNELKPEPAPAAKPARSR